jgi:ABC-2 type transport system ATP-binding protein
MITPSALPAPFCSTECPSAVAPGTLAVGRLDHVTKRFGPVTALDDVSIAFQPGRVTSLLGPNGAGKTTLVRLLLGLTRPQSGQVTLFGVSPASTAARTRIGVMLQAGRLPHALRVIEHVQLFSSYYPAPLPLDEVIEAAGLRGLERRLFGKLSGGQQQRVMFAIAICGNPDLLVLDEPTASLDVEARRTMWRAIRGWAARGSAVLLTTHDLDEAESLSDRVAVLQRGRLIRDGAPDEIAREAAHASLTCISSLTPADARNLPGVIGAELLGRTLRLLSSTPERTVTALLGRDPTLSDLQIARASLEDAFIALTATTTRPG